MGLKMKAKIIIRAKASAKGAPKLVAPKKAGERKPGTIDLASQTPIKWPKCWLWFVDEFVPSYVKKHYSPKDTWKDKPFSTEDVRFFSKGVEELSDLFTEERSHSFGRSLPAYFAHPKFRSSYLLYFLPLQAAKFLTLYHKHSGAMDLMLKKKDAEAPLRVADIGSGPGTASLALLMYLLETSPDHLPQFEFHWLDTDLGVLRDGRALIESLSQMFPKLRGKVTLHTYQEPWWKAPQVLTSGEGSADPKFDLIAFGHVLNEATQSKAFRSEQARLSYWEQIFARTQGAGVLFVEPAARGPSQQIAQMRNEFVESGIIQNQRESIWGPCLHSGVCPLAEGRDWCHFSENLQIPGKWFREFSKGLGSERHWIKYSYLWIAAPGFPAKKPSPKARLVVSDPLQEKGPAYSKQQVLLCQPERVEKVDLPRGKELFRGDLFYF